MPPTIYGVFLWTFPGIVENCTKHLDIAYVPTVLEDSIRSSQWFASSFISALSNVTLFPTIEGLPLIAFASPIWQSRMSVGVSLIPQVMEESFSSRGIAGSLASGKMVLEIEIQPNFDS